MQPRGRAAAGALNHTAGARAVPAPKPSCAIVWRGERGEPAVRTARGAGGGPSTAVRGGAGAGGGGRAGHAVGNTRVDRQGV